jgi:dipeptidase E
MPGCGAARRSGRPRGSRPWDSRPGNSTFVSTTQEHSLHTSVILISCGSGGGNVFLLREAMARSGMDKLIVNRLQEDAFVYAGFSAGACILAPTLRGLEDCDSTADCLATYGSVRFDGLNILDRPVVPHLQSPEHPESAALTRLAARYDRTNQRYWPLQDNQALVINGSTTTPI